MSTVERDSEHTIAQGIVKSAEERKLAVPKASQFEASKRSRAMECGRSWSSDEEPGAFLRRRQLRVRCHSHGARCPGHGNVAQELPQYRPDGERQEVNARRARRRDDRIAEKRHP